MQYVVFLRGVNVGGRILKMEELRNCLKGAGFSGVTTILQTGNAIVDSDDKDVKKLTVTIEDAISKEFSFPAKVLVITPGQLADVIENNPFTNAGTEYHQYVVFTKNGFEKQLVEDSEYREVEKVAQGSGVVYWQVKKGLTLDSPFAKAIAKAAAKEFITTRNMNTLNKIAAKVGGRQ